MNKLDNLKEVKRNEIGKGLLIEHDGHISLMDDANKLIRESLEKDNDNWSVPYPFIVHAVFQKYGIKNANGRIYPEKILKKQVDSYQNKIKERGAYGELNHPQDSTIDLGRISLNIVELYWKGCTLMGKLEIITTHGFRKYGICSTKGDELAHLILSKLKVGVSSRGIGSVEQINGNYVVGDDFELVCWDAVSDPSTPGAWIDTDVDKLNVYVENINTKQDDKYKNFINWLDL